MNEEHRREGTGWMPWLIIALIAGGVGIRFALPSIGAFSAKNRSHCVKNLKLLGIALHNYHYHWGTFPPAYFADSQGKPMHSWRIILLPYYESPDSKALASQYDFMQPWNSPHNLKLADRMPQEYRCPSSDGPAGQASYLAVVGSETGWPAPHSATIQGIGDGTANTVALVEVANSGINWLDPRDLSFDEAMKKIESPHYGGANHLFFDGSVHFLKSDVDRTMYRAMLTANGNEVVEIPE